ncbi:hypothetical protein SO802_006142 [Lithocarpus litseifolius]|uniref:Uncharacterized protein n=1 Tax=Lithocarpus litseifolius TaxID=425828 RepID=A0AAW2DNE6_9ROSI
MQRPTSQAPVSGLPIGVSSSSGLSTPIAAASAPGAVCLLPNAPTPSGSLQQSASSSVFQFAGFSIHMLVHML